jgi:hypothetical protein
VGTFLPHDGDDLGGACTRIGRNDRFFDKRRLSRGRQAHEATSGDL